MQLLRILLPLLLVGGVLAQGEFDLVVYGGTAGGAMTAVAGARHGLKTVLLEPGNHIGGMVSGGLSGTDVGKNYGYPDGSYAERARIWQDHVLYQKGFYYFLANDPRVPASLQQEVRQWGLARDEFADTGHWPHQLYVREGRRMVGDFVATQKDLQTERSKPDAIGMGSYNSDSHNVQRHVAEGGIVLNEGDVQVPVQPYQIPYRLLLPRRAEAENVLVPVCFSASHVAYSSLRMEPQYMIIGHAAGVAAALALQGGVPVQEVPIGKLQAILRRRWGL